jgi:hypothetical protein
MEQWVYCQIYNNQHYAGEAAVKLKKDSAQGNSLGRCCCDLYG